MYVSLGRFRHVADSAIGVPAWVPPAGVSQLVDLVPPKLDAEPDVNFALMLSESPLDSADAHYTFGNGNVTEMTMAGADCSQLRPKIRSFRFESFRFEVVA